MVRGIFAKAGLALVAIVAICAAADAVAAPNQTVIHNFIPTPEGILPQSALVADSSGALYGTTKYGGEMGLGTVFKLTPPTAGHTVWTESVLHSFHYDTGNSGTLTHGGLPTTALTPDGSGGFFGTTSGGGAYRDGTIFQLTAPAIGKTDWTETVLYSFNSSNPGLGNAPLGALVLDSSGALYGVLGAPEDVIAGGIVFKLVPPTSAGGAWSFEKPPTFNSSANGLSPNGPLVVDRGGTVYGVTSGGGRSSQGTLFQLVPPIKGGSAWTETVLHNFGLSGGDVISPTGGLVEAANGALYGTGFSSNGGSIFKMTPPASGQSAWVETTLPAIINSHRVVGVANGPIAIDADGALYGTASYNTDEGSPSFAFKLVPPAQAGDGWTETELSAFNSFSVSAGLVRDAKGTLYGTALPFSTDMAHNQGIVFDIVPPVAGENSWTEHTLFSFGTTDGYFPGAALVADNAGNLYGTTEDGGVYGYGAVFKLVPPTVQHPAWTESILHSFNGADGNSPSASLLIDANGAIYGTTFFGGVVFKLTPPAKGGTAWLETVLQSFYSNESSSHQSANLEGSLVIDKSGSVYGVIPFGGKYNKGQVFKLTPPMVGNVTWSESGIYDFSPSGLGYNINPGLVIDDSGVLYMTTSGYNGSRAVALKLVPPSHAATGWAVGVIYRFAAGDAPESPSFVDSSGALFGTSANGGAYDKGFVYKLAPTEAAHAHWTETTLHSFGKGSDAVNPLATVSLDKNGAVYGTALGDYYGNNAVIFKLTPPSTTMAGWTESILGQYASDPNIYPTWGIYTTPNGTVYGTTLLGGPASAGTVFQITQ